MGHKLEWFNDDDFWEQYTPLIFDESRWAEVPKVTEGVTRLARPDRCEGKKPAILDLCCGPGRITLELARRGLSVTGVDISECYIRTAREKAAREGLEIEFIKKDVRSFKRKNAFDAAVNLYNSFGYFEDPMDDLCFLKNAHYSLKEGGALIIDVLGKEIAVRDYTEADWFERAGITFLTESNPVDSYGSMWNRWVLIKGGKRREKIFIQRLYAASELRSLLLRAGFASAEIYGDWDESPYDEKAQTLLAVGRK